MLKIRATEEQIKKIAINAIEASRPVGMGHFQYDPKQKFSADDIQLVADFNPGIFLDYVGGRMVKLQIWKKGDNDWEMPSHEPRLDYQSWIWRYPTYEALAISVDGVEVLKE